MVCAINTERALCDGLQTAIPASGAAFSLHVSEWRLDAFNTKLHGIGPKTVAKALQMTIAPSGDMTAVAYLTRLITSGREAKPCAN